MPPPLPADQLGQPIRIDQASGVTPDTNANLTRDVGVCSSRDLQRARLWVNPSGTQLVAISMFPTNDLAGMDAASQGRMQDINQTLWQQIVGARGDFLYSAQLQNGRFTTLFQPVCREANPATGTSDRYRLFLADMDVIGNSREDLRGMVAIREQSGQHFILRDPEIIALVQGAQLDGAEYSVSRASRGVIHVSEQLQALERISHWLGSDAGAAAFPDPVRRSILTGIIDRNAEVARNQAWGLHWQAVAGPVLGVIASVAALVSIGGMVYMAKLMKRQMDMMGAISGGTKAGQSALEQYGRDITRAAREGRLNAVLGRGAEIQRMVEILGKRQVANPLLVGPTGSGKTAIVEGFVQRLVRGEFLSLKPELTRVVEISLTAVKAGGGVVGQIEGRIHAILREVGINITDKGDAESELKPGERVILFTDEIHDINKEPARGTPSVMQILKPALSRGLLSLVGATTDDEVHLIEQPEAGGHVDKAATRRFDRIDVSAMTAGQSIDLLIENRPQYERDGITLTDPAIREAVRLTDAFVPDQYFPDKAIQLIDRVVSSNAGQNIKGPITPEMVRSAFSVASGLTEEAMKLELSLRTEKAAEEAARKTQAIRSSLENYLNRRGVPATRMAQTIDAVIRLWEQTPAAERGVYLAHDPTAQANGLIPNRFVERNATALGLTGAPATAPLNRLRVDLRDGDVVRALADMDPDGRRGLVRAYRTISSKSRPLRNIGQFFKALYVRHPDLMSSVVSDLRRQGVDANSNPWRALFEATARLNMAGDGPSAPRSQATAPADRLKLSSDFARRMSETGNGSARKPGGPKGRPRSDDPSERVRQGAARRGRP